jgi:hypothetical protein
MEQEFHMKRLVTVFEYVATSDNNPILGPISPFNWIFCIVSPDGSDNVCQFELYAFEDRIDKIICHTYPNLRPTEGVHHSGHEFDTPNGLIYTGKPGKCPPWKKNRKFVFLNRLDPQKRRAANQKGLSPLVSSLRNT